MRSPLLCMILLTGAAACDSPPATQPEDFNVVNATVTDPGAAPGALGNESVNYPEGNVTPAEQAAGNQAQAQPQSSLQAAQAFADLLELRRFDDAYAMWDPRAADFEANHFERQFERFATINAEVGQAAGGSGGADQVQLTLTGETQDGASYTLTGPLTLARSGGGAGSWRIAKLVLTSDARAADALVEPQGGGQQDR